MLQGYESKDPGRRDTGVSLIDQMPGLSLQSSSSLNTPKQELVAVDGVPQHTVDIWFAEADSSGSGSIADRDAITFFKRTGLSPTVLSTVSAGSTATLPQGRSQSRTVSCPCSHGMHCSEQSQV